MEWRSGIMVMLHFAFYPFSMHANPVNLAYFTLGSRNQLAITCPIIKCWVF